MTTRDEFNEATQRARAEIATKQLSLVDAAHNLATVTLAEITKCLTDGKPLAETLHTGLMTAALAMAQILGHDAVSSLEGTDGG